MLLQKKFSLVWHSMVLCGLSFSLTLATLLDKTVAHTQIALNMLAQASNDMTLD